MKIRIIVTGGTLEITHGTDTISDTARSHSSSSYRSACTSDEQQFLPGRKRDQEYKDRHIRSSGIKKQVVETTRLLTIKAPFILKNKKTARKLHRFISPAIITWMFSI